jgi:hypothetical protein
MNAPPKPSIESKTKKKKSMIIIEGPDNNPFGSIGKLLGGFCDPTHGDNDDNTTVASTPSWRYVPEDKSREVVLEEDSGGLSYGLNNNNDGDSTSVLKFKPDPPIVDDKAGMEEDEKEVVKERTLPVLKASNVGPRLRRRRGLEVAIVGIVFVVGTLFSLHRLGYEFDLKVVERKWQSGIDIVFNENNATVVPEKMKKWIDIAFKKEPVKAEKVQAVEQKKALDEEKDKAEGSSESQHVETKAEVVEDEATTEDEPRVAVERPVPDAGDTAFDTDEAHADAQATLEEELLTEILGEEL